MTAQPWFKFYPSDWRSDPTLRICSLAARGLWGEMLCVMHEAEPRGHLRINGIPVTPKQLAALVGCPLREVEQLIEELESAGVFSRENGVIYSRRMVRDTAKAAKDKANGSGGGNPSLNGSGGKGVNPPVNPEVKAQKPDTTSQNQKPISESSNLDSEFGVPSALVANLIKGATKKVEKSNYVWLKDTDTRIPRAKAWWREHYGGDLPIAFNGNRQGFRVPWAAVQ